MLSKVVEMNFFNINYLGRTCKGQSAIEYLTTYGWMLLVVAIVGGSIFTTVQNQGRIQSTSGLANADVQVSDFGVTDSGFQAELRGASSDQIEDVNFSLTDPETGETVSRQTGVIPVGDTETVSLKGVESSETANTYDVEVEYDSGGLEDLEETGKITAQIEIKTNNSNDSEGNENSDDLEPISAAHSSAPDCSTVSYNGSGTSEDPYNITDDWQLQCTGNSSSGVAMDDTFLITQDINASLTNQWNNGKGFKPIGSTSNYFHGKINGGNKSINGINIERPSENYIGIVSQLGGYEGGRDVVEKPGKFININLKNVEVKGNNNVGSIAGYVETYESSSTVKNVNFSGTVKGNDSVGGISGEGGELLRVHSQGTVENTTSISEDIGGLVGYAGYSTIYNSSNGADVTGNRNIGGLVGSIEAYSSVEDSFSYGEISGNTNIGAIAGNKGGTADIITQVYYDNQSSGQIKAIGSETDPSTVTGLTTSQMQGASAETNMGYLDFNNTWKTVESPEDYPRLQ